jgi:hypothetical protein
MTLARKTQAKYGAKIPTAQTAGAKPAQQGKRGTSVDASAKAARAAKASDDQKR